MSWNAGEVSKVVETFSSENFRFCVHSNKFITSETRHGLHRLLQNIFQFVAKVLVGEKLYFDFPFPFAFVRVEV